MHEELPEQVSNIQLVVAFVRSKFNLQRGYD